MNVRRRSGQMSHSMGGPIKNAVTQRKDSPTTPKAIPNQITQAKTPGWTVRNAVTKCTK